MNDIEWIRKLRKEGITIDEIGRLTGISRELVRRVLRNELPDSINLKEFNLCPYGTSDCRSFEDDICSCGITDTQFFHLDGTRKPCPFFKDKKTWREEEVRGLKAKGFSYVRIAEALDLSVSYVQNIWYQSRKKALK